MPTPGGNLTTSDIWKQQQEANPPAKELKNEQETVPAEEVQED